MNIILKVSEVLARYTSPFIIVVAVLAFLFPSIFAWVQQGQTSTVILGLIMLTMGCTLSMNDFVILMKQPFHIIIGALAQYTIMPIIAHLLSQIFHLDAFMAAGLIMVGCCPGGVSSNLMTYLCKGDVAYSVGMTTVSTLLAPFVTPVLMLTLSGAEIEIDAMGMFINILIVTLLPVTLGCTFNYFLSKKKYFKEVQGVMPGISVICLALIVGGVIYQVSPHLKENAWNLIGLTLLIVMLHNGLGYLLGYGVAKSFKFNTAKCRTLSLEVGMQNAGMATVLARNFLCNPAIVAFNPMAVVSVIPCALSCVYHSISGTLLAGFFQIMDKRKRK